MCLFSFEELCFSTFPVRRLSQAPFIWNEDSNHLGGMAKLLCLKVQLKIHRTDILIVVRLRHVITQTHLKVSPLTFSLRDPLSPKG